MYIGQPVRLIKITCTTPTIIPQHFGFLGIVKGFRLINNNFIVPIIEFDAQTRIWLFEDEIEAL
uniref:Cytochrome b6-f complex subunit PetP n=1 Tax=Gronococcus sybilensis TaxID=3028029 RepID=A0A9Y1I2N0_9RHOD|nr:hypothetical protein GRSY_171 [Gronococcus sybilensis]